MEDAEMFYKLDNMSLGFKNYAELKLLSKIQNFNPKSILEIGSGNGHFLKNFTNIEHYGIDKNLSMVILANKNGIDVKYCDILVENNLKNVVGNKVDIICANYVFTEMKYLELKVCFQNIYRQLNDKGHLCFTITNPRENHRKIFPDYRVIFEEKYEYYKRDIPFRVELKDENGDFTEVGILDYHKPVSDYNYLLKECGFSILSIDEIYRNLPYPHALLYDVQK
ncbi:MAG: methyltransferase domain-containing protein [Nanoarchaeota archaeon]|nr:methyltransferase domain-containing protein [Nanoarchaeota archaeon]